MVRLGGVENAVSLGPFKRGLGGPQFARSGSQVVGLEAQRFLSKEYMGLKPRPHRSLWKMVV